MPMHALKRVRSAFQLTRRSHDDNDDELTPLGVDPAPALPPISKDSATQEPADASSNFSASQAPQISDDLPSPTDFAANQFSMPQWDSSSTASTASPAASKKPVWRSENRERSRQDSKTTNTSSSRASSCTSSSACQPQLKHQHPLTSLPRARRGPSHTDRWINEETNSSGPLSPASASPSKFGVRSRSTPSIPTLGLLPHIPPVAPPPVPPKAIPPTAPRASPPLPRRPPPPVPLESVSPRQQAASECPQEACGCHKSTETANRQGPGLPPQPDELLSDSLQDLMKHMQSLCQRLEAVLNQRKQLGIGGR